MKTNKKIIIIGAGLSGLSAAYYLKKDYIIFEKDSRVGGLCKSEYENGFIFDYTGHLLHIDNEYVKKLIKKLLKGNLTSHIRNSWIFSKGVYTKYPFQANTYGLPPKIIKECLLGLIEAKYKKTKRRIRTFEDWILNIFGEGIAKHFMIPYNEKLWRVHPKQMSIEWLNAYVPTPSIEEFINGALSEQNKDFGYNVKFWYPLKGGICSLSKGFLKYIKKLQVKHKVTQIDTINKKIQFNDSASFYYDKIVSTMPLPELIKIIKDVPRDIKQVASSLKYTSVLNVNLGINRRISNKHWIYFPEKKFVFYRVGFHSNFSPYMALRGTSSIYTEISYSRDESIDKKGAIKKVKQDLIKANILKREDKVLVVKVVDIKYAYAVYDFFRQKNLKKIQNFLKKNDIYSIGRYGKWEYSDMESAILEGKNIANFLNKKPC